jgi:hypothetical protein
MGFLEFAAGYALGAKAGSEGFDRVLASGKAIFESREFRDFVAALRSHAAHTLRELASLLAPEQTEPRSGDIVGFVRSLVDRQEEAFRRVSETWRQPPSP